MFFGTPRFLRGIISVEVTVMVPTAVVMVFCFVIGLVTREVAVLVL